MKGMMKVQNNLLIIRKTSPKLLMQVSATRKNYAQRKKHLGKFL
jgi:hypothetical protein